MPIDKSTPWGEQVPVSPEGTTGLPTFVDERAVSEALSAARHTEIRLTGGDFVEITGGIAPGRETSRRYPCDALEIRGLDSTSRSIGTVELRRRRRRISGGFVILSNLGVRGSERYSSRAHPNDGKFEVVDALDGLTWRERMTLARRFSRGGDFSHPRVKQRQTTSYTSQVPLHVFVDGVYRGRKAVTVEILLDFLWIHV
jgi:hypothetical protein